MTPTIKLLTEQQSNESIHIYAQVSYGNHGKNILLSNYFSSDLWKYIEEGFLKNGVDYILTLSNTNKELFHNHRYSLLILYHKLSFLELVCSTEYNFSNSLGIDFDLEAVHQGYDSLFSDTRFNNEYSKKIKTILSSKQYETLEYKASQDNESVDNLIDKILQDGINNIPTFDYEDELDSIYDKIESSSKKIMGGYTKKFYTYLISKIEDNTEPGTPLVTAISVKKLRKVLTLENKYERTIDLEIHILSRVVKKINSVTDIYISNIHKDKKTYPSKYTISYELKLDKKKYPEYTLTSAKKRRKHNKPTTAFKSSYTAKERKFIRPIKDLPNSISYLLNKGNTIYEFNYNSLNKHQLPGSYIYFLIDKNDVVYVGQTRGNLTNRIHSHKLSKDFERCVFMDCPISKLDSIEYYFIMKLIPKYNKVLKLISIDESHPLVKNYIDS